MEVDLLPCPALEFMMHRCVHIPVLLGLAFPAPGGFGSVFYFCSKELSDAFQIPRLFTDYIGLDLVIFYVILLCMQSAGLIAGFL